MKTITLLFVLILGIGFQSFSQRHPVMQRYKDNFLPQDIKNEFNRVVVTPLNNYQILYMKNFFSSLTGEENISITFDNFKEVDTTLLAGSYFNTCWNDTLNKGKGGIEPYPGKYFTTDNACKLYKYFGPKVYKGDIFYKGNCGNIILIPKKENKLSLNDAPFVVDNRGIKSKVHKQVIVYDTIHIHENYQQPQQLYQQQYQQQAQQQSSGGYWFNSGVTFHPDLSYYNSYYPYYYYSGYSGYYGRRTYPIIRIRTSTVTNRRR